MKIIFTFSILMAFFGFVAVPNLALAQDEASASRPANPGDDPNEAMSDQGAGVPNYGCPDPSKSCLARLKHGRLGDNTTFRPGATGGDAGKGSPDGSTEGNR
jgi:hypothetical protein